MFCKNCGKPIADDAKFCPECGARIDTKSDDIPDHSNPAPMPKKQKKRTPGCLIFIIVLLVALVAVLSPVFLGLIPESAGYASIDQRQSTESRYEAVAAAMDDALEDAGYFPIDYSVEWVGYSKYEDLYSESEYEEMKLGGYYTYAGKLSTGEIANARIQTYWDDTDATLLDLSIETAAGEKVLVEYSDDKILDCWNTYYAKAKPTE